MGNSASEHRRVSRKSEETIGQGDNEPAGEEQLGTAVVEQTDNTPGTGNAEAVQETNISYWLRHLNIYTTSLIIDDMLWSPVTLREITRRSLKEKWGGDTMRKISVTTRYNWRFCPRELAFELRYHLPWCEIEVKYIGENRSRRTEHHLAEVNRLLKEEHYASVATLQAARAIGFDD